MKDNAYKQAGVDIDAGNQFVDQIKSHVARTNRPGVMGQIGAFGGLFDLKKTGYSDPVIVAATDGVGTKLKIAIETMRFDTVGVDLVAMCVNDLIVQGAEPLFFLDYFATGKLHPDRAEQVVKGIADGCEQSNCALIGGETAEMPGMYHGDDFDLAGFCVGAVDRENIIDGSGIDEGQIILGIASTGVHSNGFSLVRHILKQQNLTWSDNCPFDNTMKVADEFLKPTALYVRSLMDLFKTYGHRNVSGLAHVTGGGLTENIPRVLPENCAAEIDLQSWDRPAVFKWLQSAGKLSESDMLKTFNCGIGMALICNADHEADFSKLLQSHGHDVYKIGRIIKGEATVIYK